MNKTDLAPWEGGGKKFIPNKERPPWEGGGVPLTPEDAILPGGFDVDAAKTGLLESLSFGTKPTIEGIGAGIGAGYESLAAGTPIADSLSQSFKAFKKGREGAIRESEKAFQKSPYSYGAGALAGALPYSGLSIGGLGLRGAAMTGAAYGLGEAVGHAEDKGDVVFMIGGGAAGGALGHTIGEAGGKILREGSRKIVKLGSDFKGYLNKKFPSVLPKISLYKLGEAITSVPDEAIREYTNKVDKINKIIKEEGADWLGAANALRDKANSSIQRTKNDLALRTTRALAGSDVVADIGPVVNPMLDELEKLNPNLEQASYVGVKDILEKLTREAGANDGFVSLVNLYKIKKHLQDQSRKAFLKEGKIFIQDTGVSRIARKGYTAAKKILDSLAPEIKEINGKYTKLHQIEERMFSNLLKEDKPAASLFAGGLGTNPRFKKTLDDISKITGVDITSRAKELATAEIFGKNKMTGLIPTGQDMANMMRGAGVSVLISKAIDVDPQVGAAIGFLAANPAGVKTIINAGNVSRKAVLKMIDAVKNPRLQRIIIKEGIELGAFDEMLRNLYIGVLAREAAEKGKNARKD